MTSFVDDVLAGRTTLDAVDDYVDRWHDGDGDGGLADYLGLSSDEYAAWITDAGALGRVIDARRVGATRLRASA